jgi:hypothetical protein
VREFKNSVLKGVFGPKREEVTGKDSDLLGYDAASLVKCFLMFSKNMLPSF